MAEVLAVLPDNRVLIKETITGPASYTAGGFSHTISNVSVVDAILAASATGGYKVDAAAITVSGNTLTIPVYYYDYDAAADGAAIEVPDGTDLSGITITVIAIAR